MNEATLCHPIIDGQLLLIRKQRGLGEGKLLGPGGKVEPGETPREATIREVREELQVNPIGIEKCGEFEFHFRTDEPTDDSMFVHVFTASGIEGEPTETAEAVPEWHPATNLPYEEMWVDDRFWMPHMLAGESFAGTFVLTDDGEAMHRYEMELGQTFD